MLSWKIAPAYFWKYSCLNQLKPHLNRNVFCRACIEAKIPPGVVNIVNGDGETGSFIVKNKNFKNCFTGSTEVGRLIRKETAGKIKNKFRTWWKVSFYSF